MKLTRVQLYCALRHMRRVRDDLLQQKQQIELKLQGISPGSVVMQAEDNAWRALDAELLITESIINDLWLEVAKTATNYVPIDPMSPLHPMRVQGNAAALLSRVYTNSIQCNGFVNRITLINLIVALVADTLPTVE